MAPSNSFKIALALVASFLQAEQTYAFSVGSASLSSTGRTINNHGPLFVSTLTKDSIEQFAAPETGSVDSSMKLRQVALSPEHSMDEQEDVDSFFPFGNFDYGAFAKDFPLVNNMMIASAKAALADVFAQTVIGQTGLDALDWQRTFLFCLFGALYQGGFQYLYQVNIFSKLFDVEKFTSQSWSEKLKDGPGLQSLALQVLLDLAIMSSIYLPTYYTFKASIFSDVMDPSAWLQDGMSCYGSHFHQDETDLLRVWLPADLLCFSAPLILRLPMRQVISLFYTAYLSASSFGVHS